MRFKLTLNIDKCYGNRLPFNYQYELSSTIYKILGQSNSAYAEWLHNNGFTLDNKKRFKLFCFSRLQFDKYTLFPNRDQIPGFLRLDSNKAFWEIGILPENSTSEFIKGLFSNRNFVLGDSNYKVAFEIVNIESQETVFDYGEHIFKTLSPVCVKLHNDNVISYLSPSIPKFADGILKGLKSRYRAIAGHDLIMQDSDFVFKPTSNWKPRLITIKADTEKQTQVRGYMFDFFMQAPQELMRIAYEGGIGEECSQGFGYIKLK